MDDLGPRRRDAAMRNPSCSNDEASLNAQRSPGKAMGEATNGSLT